MEVRKSFAKAVTDIAVATPREAVANLLRSMLPREPVRTRPISASPTRSSPTFMDTTDGPVMVMRDPFKPLRPVRARKLRNRVYAATGKRNAARYGSKRYNQLEIVLGHTTTRDARLAGAESVDITFAEDEGYIKFTD